MPYYNCHAHVFNQPCAPERFLNSYVNNTTAALLRGLTNFGPTRWLVGWVSQRRIPEKWRRPLSFLTIGSQKTQEDVFNDLGEAYPAGTRMVALTLNMEHMGAGECKVDYKTQLDEVLRLKRKYPDTCLPFLCLDPRMNPQRFGGNNLAEVARLYINQGFVGIKLYPALGFYPNDPALYPVYAFAEAENVPITIHCDRGGAFFRSGQAGHPPAPFAYPWLNLDTAQPDNEYSDNYLEPQTIELLLLGDVFLNIADKFPRLKICLAHFGGTDDVLSSPALPPQRVSNWYEIIKRLMLQFDNVYADVSYTLYAPNARTKILADAQQTPKLADRILFGTDFYMVARELPERELLAGFQSAFGSVLFTKLAEENAKRFLQSTFYTPL